MLALGGAVALGAMVDHPLPGARLTDGGWLLGALSALVVALLLALPQAAALGLARTVAFVTPLLALGRAVDNGFYHYYHRPFRVVLDAPLLPEWVRLMINTEGPGAVASWGGLLLVGLGLWGWGLGRVLACLLRGAWGRPAARWQGVIVSAFAAGLILWVATSPTRGMAARLVEEVRFARELPKLEFELATQLKRHAGGEWPGPAALAGADIYVIFIESYGRGALESEAGVPRLSELLAALQARLEQRGLAVRSGFLTAPTFGGGSWFCHATFATGIRTTTPIEYSLLLRSQAHSLSRWLRHSGYETFNVLPGTRGPWPEGRFYDFEHTWTAHDFDYCGPELGWGRLPDQYVLDQVRRKIHRSERPLYVEMKLVTSHVPWRQVPPVLPWEEVACGSSYRQHPARVFPIRWSDLAHADVAYEAAIRYDLEVVFQFIARFVGSDALVVVLGDHSPVHEATGSDSWDVPIHVVGAPRLVAPFSVDFGSGMRPLGVPIAMEDWLVTFRERLNTTAQL